MAREWQRLADRERRITHGLSASIVKGYGLVAVEGLPIGNMSRSAAGTVEEPGKNVLAKSGLNRHILEQRWGRMYAQLRYKAASAGIPFVRVDPAHTSQACANCGAIDAIQNLMKSDTSGLLEARPHFVIHLTPHRPLPA